MHMLYEYVLNLKYYNVPLYMLYKYLLNIKSSLLLCMLTSIGKQCLVAEQWKEESLRNRG